MALSRTAVTVSTTVLTTVHCKVIGRAKFRKASITAELMHHILVIYLMPDLGKEMNRSPPSTNEEIFSISINLVATYNSIF